MTRIKICGLRRRSDAEVAIDCGADALGFVMELTSPRRITAIELGEMADTVPPYVFAVGVYGRYSPAEHAPFFDAVQAIDVDQHVLPEGCRSVLAYRMGSGQDLPDLASVDALLIDSFSPDEYGGTGKKIDVEPARRLMHETSLPVIVAGGLTPANVGAVVRALRPFAVDVSSGVEEEPGVKSADLIAAFVAAVREADDSE